MLITNNLWKNLRFTNIFGNIFCEYNITDKNNNKSSWIKSKDLIKNLILKFNKKNFKNIFSVDWKREFSFIPNFNFQHHRLVSFSFARSCWMNTLYITFNMQFCIFLQLSVWNSYSLSFRFTVHLAILILMFMFLGFKIIGSDFLNKGLSF